MQAPLPLVDRAAYDHDNGEDFLGCEQLGITECRRIRKVRAGICNCRAGVYIYNMMRMGSFEEDIRREWPYSSRRRKWGGVWKR